MVNLQYILGSVLLVCFVLQLTTAQESQEVSQLEKYYYDKCLKTSGGTAAFEKLRNDAYEMFQYFKYAFQFLPNQRAIFCKSERPSLVTRIKEIEKDLKSCLASNEQYFAGFIRESFQEFLHFFCHNEGEYTKRLFNYEAAQCRKKIQGSNSKDLEYCLNRIFAPIQGYVSKKELCDDITVGQKCFVQLLESHCPTAYDFKKLNEQFFSYIGKPCSSCVHLVSSLVLMGSILAHILINIKI